MIEICIYHHPAVHNSPVPGSQKEVALAFTRMIVREVVNLCFKLQEAAGDGQVLVVKNELMVKCRIKSTVQNKMTSKGWRFSGLRFSRANR